MKRHRKLGSRWLFTECSESRQLAAWAQSQAPRSSVGGAYDHEKEIPKGGGKGVFGGRQQQRRRFGTPEPVRGQSACSRRSQRDHPGLLQVEVRVSAGPSPDRPLPLSAAARTASTAGTDPSSRAHSRCSGQRDDVRYPFAPRQGLRGPRPLCVRQEGFCAPNEQRRVKGGRSVPEKIPDERPEEIFAIQVIVLQQAGAGRTFL